MRERVPRPVQLQNPLEDARGREVLSVRAVRLRVHLRASLGVAHADPLGPETLPMSVLRSNVPSEAAAEATREHLPQSGLRGGDAAGEEPQLPDVR